jgi:transposase
MSLKRRVFSKEFKLHVLREVESGKTQAEIARKYQILPKMISRWLGEHETYAKEAFAGAGKTYTDSARIAALERNIAQLEMENELLKKALTQLDQARDLETQNGESE